MSENSSPLFRSVADTPLGKLNVIADPSGIKIITWDAVPEIPVNPSPLTQNAVEQLSAYFKGESNVFDLPLAPDGTPFQQNVWNALLNIPYSKTQSYLELARRLGDEKATRAVGNANRNNPIAIVIPCHRVIGSNGKLTGYAGGVHRKRFLLGLEQGGVQGTLF